MDKKLLGEYENGNYNVKIYEDGTKIRENDLDNLSPAFPESIDCKITNKCDMNCPYCHEQSTNDGKHGDILNADFIDTLKPYTEIAIGGGNPLSHPDLVEFLLKLKENDIIANITVNKEHFIENLTYIDALIRNNLIKGLGVSVDSVNEGFIRTVKQFPNAVIHVINGVIPFEDLLKLSNEGLKILILGYKNFGRGGRLYFR